jgi:hypothetical protein
VPWRPPPAASRRPGVAAARRAAGARDLREPAGRRPRDLLTLVGAPWRGNDRRAPGNGLPARRRPSGRGLLTGAVADASDPAASAAGAWSPCKPLTPRQGGPPFGSAAHPRAGRCAALLLGGGAAQRARPRTRREARSRRGRPPAPFASRGSALGPRRRQPALLAVRQGPEPRWPARSAPWRGQRDHSPSVTIAVPDALMEQAADPTVAGEAARAEGRIAPWRLQAQARRAAGRGPAQPPAAAGAPPGTGRCAPCNVRDAAEPPSRSAPGEEA